MATSVNVNVQELMTTLIRKYINQSAHRHLAKEQVKTQVATQFIGEGAIGSSTENYKNMYDLLGLANTGNYRATDVIYVSSNGKRHNRVDPVDSMGLLGVYRNIDLAMKVKAKFIMDTRAHLVRTKEYNLGEVALAHYFHTNGYGRVKGTGVWIHKGDNYVPPKPQEDSLDQFVATVGNKQ